MHHPTQVIGSKQLVGRNPAFLEEIRKIHLIATSNSSVLIFGETGTGKELCAKLIHQHSHRAGNPFVPVNCGAVPVELAENELFGHKQGAFTGAEGRKPGLIQEAEGGTLFLDEIDSLPLLAQVKLLRFLQDKTYRPLGSTRERRADVRVLAATGTDPLDAVRSGRLRQDLYYRLNVILITLPPLRERKEDIPLLACHFLEKLSADLCREVPDLSSAAMRKLTSYDWPGNVRELEHVIERTVVLCGSHTIREEDIVLPQLDSKPIHESFNEAKKRFVHQFERGYIQKLLILHEGNISKAAEAAQKHRRAFWELIRKHDIDAGKFRLQH
jgi:transcriptional regulator with PAS, ATPase and Fis domain